MGRRKYSYPIIRECECCGAKFAIDGPNGLRKRWCPACTSFITRGVIIDSIDKPEEKHVSHLARYERAARAADMTYGRYRGSILAGITPSVRQHMSNISWVMWKAEIYAIVRRQKLRTLAERG